MSDDATERLHLDSAGGPGRWARGAPTAQPGRPLRSVTPGAGYFGKIPGKLLELLTQGPTTRPFRRRSCGQGFSARRRSLRASVGVSSVCGGGRRARARWRPRRRIRTSDPTHLRMSSAGDAERATSLTKAVIFVYLFSAHVAGSQCFIFIRVSRTERSWSSTGFDF